MAASEREKAALGVGMILVVAALVVVVKGFVIRDYWHWFVEPLGVPGITLAQAIGIGILGAVVANMVGFSPSTPEQRDRMFTSLLWSFPALAFVWLAGWALAHG